MTRSDRDLGMDRAITRRDFLNGVSIAIGATLTVPAGLDAFGMPQAGAPEMAPDYYPPARTGMRGNHPGSFEVAHAMRDGKTWETGEDTGEFYDLVVVGGGLSGLAAAYFFRKKAGPTARILILDNHDDFGGHAKRNEFTIDGRLLIAGGGTAYIERPATYTAEGRELLTNIGVDFYSPQHEHDRDLYSSLGLRPAVYFDKETFGVDRLVIREGGRVPSREFLAKTPLSAHVQQDLLRLYGDKRDYLAELSDEEKVRKLKKTSYQDYLLSVVKVHPDVLRYFHPRGAGVLTTDATSAWFAFNHGQPGFEGLGLELAPDAPAMLDANRPDKSEPTQFYFPEGNAGVARLLVRSLIPEALPGRSMADAETTRVNYARLDEPGNGVRVRLNSTAVRVRNDGDQETATNVDVIYVRDGKASRVRAKGCVLACYNAVIPYLVPELPAAQKAALHLAVRGVNIWINVGIRNWKASEKLGVSSISCPGSLYPGYAAVRFNQAVSLGRYRWARTPSDPIVLNLGSSGSGIKLQSGLPARDQFRAAREDMYRTTFETFERKIRTHLARVLGDGGFDPAHDIEAITVNRWPHGFAMGQNLLFDPDWTEDEYPWVVGRKRFGRITIANSDAVGVCLTQAAFDQAHRAVDELMKRHVAWWNRI